MKVLLTGQVGLDKASYVAGVAAECEKDGVRIRTLSIGRLIVAGAAGRQTEATILNLPKNELQALRANAWRRLLDEASTTTGDEVFVANSHAVLRWHHGPVPALELDVIREFSPDMIVTLIDDVDLVKKGLVERDTDIFQLWELLAWREEEIYVSRLLSEGLAKLSGREIPFYILPRKQGPGLLAQLILHPELSKVYLSFPVTGLPDEQKKDVERFKRALSTGLICFDPLAMGERSIVIKAISLAADASNVLRPGLDALVRSGPGAEGGAWSLHIDDWSALGTIEFESGGVRILGREVLGAIDAIESQIIARDYALVEQSDVIVAFIPVDEHGSPRISAGSQSEIFYAYSNGKAVYIVFPGDPRKLSPWVTEFAPGRVFATVDDCIRELIGAR